MYGRKFNPANLVLPNIDICNCEYLQNLPVNLNSIHRSGLVPLV